MIKHVNLKDEECEICGERFVFQTITNGVAGPKYCLDCPGFRRAAVDSRSTSGPAAVGPDVTFPQDQLGVK